MIETISIIENHNGRKKSRQDSVIKESFLSLFVNGNFLNKFISSPGEQKELSLGYLFSEGYINSINQVESILLDEGGLNCRIALTNKHPVLNRTEPGLPDQSVSKNKTSSQLILKLVMEFNRKSELFCQTGAVHSCAVCENDNIVLFCEDIGRHNAIDKLIGKCLLLNINLIDKIMIVSCRLSSSIVKKAHKSGVPVLVSRAAPTDVAIQYANSGGITLIGFARDNRMNIYSHDFRII